MKNTRRNLRIKEEIFSREGVGHERIPCDVLYNSPVPPLARLVYMALIGSVRPGGKGKCCPSVAKMAASLTISVRATKQALADLKRLGLIRSWKSGVPAHNNYWIERIPQWGVKRPSCGAVKGPEAEEEKQSSLSKEREDGDRALHRIREEARSEREKNPMPPGYVETWVLEEAFRKSCDSMTEKDERAALDHIRELKAESEARKAKVCEMIKGTRVLRTPGPDGGGGPRDPRD